MTIKTWGQGPGGATALYRDSTGRIRRLSQWEVAPDEANSQAAEEAELADGDSDFGVESERGDSDGSDTEFLAAIAKGPRPAAEPELPSIESLFELDDDDMAI